MRSHPLWRGFWLAAVLAAGLVLMGFPSMSALLLFDRRMLACAGGITVGAFLGALPARLRRGAKSLQRSTWQKCLRAFLCGCAMKISFSLAGSTTILPAILTGSVGALGFCLTALTAGFLTVRIMGRQRA